MDEFRRAIAHKLAVLWATRRMRKSSGLKGIKVGMIGDFDGFVMVPPKDKSYQCINCGATLLEVTVWNTQGDAHGHAMPCGCHLMPSDFARILSTGIEVK